MTLHYFLIPKSKIKKNKWKWERKKKKSSLPFLTLTSRVFRTLATFRKPYPVLLGSFKGRLYLISRFHNICLSSSKDIKSYTFSQTLFSHPNIELPTILG